MIYKFCLVRVTPTYQTLFSSSALSSFFSADSLIVFVLSKINNTFYASPPFAACIVDNFTLASFDNFSP